MRSDMKKSLLPSAWPRKHLHLRRLPKLLCQGQGGLSGGGPVSCLPGVDREARYQMSTDGIRI